MTNESVLVREAAGALLEQAQLPSPLRSEDPLITRCARQILKMARTLQPGAGKRRRFPG